MVHGFNNIVKIKSSCVSKKNSKNCVKSFGDLNFLFDWPFFLKLDIVFD